MPHRHGQVDMARHQTPTQITTFLVHQPSQGDNQAPLTAPANWTLKVGRAQGHLGPWRSHPGGWPAPWPHCFATTPPVLLLLTVRRVSGLGWHPGSSRGLGQC